MSRGLFKIVASCTAAGTQGYSETPLLLAGYPFDTALELLNGANPAMVPARLLHSLSLFVIIRHEMYSVPGIAIKIISYVNFKKSIILKALCASSFFSHSHRSVMLQSEFEFRILFFCSGFPKCMPNLVKT